MLLCANINLIAEELIYLWSGQKVRELCLFKKINLKQNGE